MGSYTLTLITVPYFTNVYYYNVTVIVEIVEVEPSYFSVPHDKLACFLYLIKAGPLAAIGVLTFPFGNKFPAMEIFHTGFTL